jgi:hypothetical protein
VRVHRSRRDVVSLPHDLEQHRAAQDLIAPFDEGHQQLEFEGRRPRFAGRSLHAAGLDAATPPLDPLPEVRDGMDHELALLPPALRRRLAGRHGTSAHALVEAAADRYELAPIPGTPDPWAALRWAARAEGVVHLDDLLLRRVRLGLLLPGGGVAHLARIRSLVAPELGWDDARWDAEEAAYRARWARDYAPLAGELLAEAVPA